MNFLPSPNISNIHQGLKVTVPGIGDLNHPIGLAAGFDKNCSTPEGFSRLGFSMLEIGTVTPFGQEGNPKPRMFRLPEQRSLINRMGFNNHGAPEVSKRLDSKNWNHSVVPLGVNLGKNKSTPLDRAVDDYLEGYKAFEGLGRYYVVNISSPNTPGLRELATSKFLYQLAEAFSSEKNGVWVKLDPDMTKKQFQEVVEAAADRGFPGLILSNTHRVEWPQAGGQSGHAISVASTRCLEWAWEVHRGQLPMIGCGGILSGLDIYEKIIRGANAVQIFTALVYRGPWVVLQLLEELSAELSLRGLKCVEDAYGTYYSAD